MPKRRDKKRRGSPRSPTECTRQERAFVDAYVGEAAGNGAAAARIAGYSDKGEGCKVRAAELLNRERVRAKIAERREEIAALEREASELVRTTKLAELVKKRAEQMLGPIATAAERQRFWAAVMHGEIEGFTSGDRMRASELLAKAQGDFNHVRHVKIDLADIDEDELWAELEESRRASGKIIDGVVTHAIGSGGEGNDDAA